LQVTQFTHATLELFITAHKNEKCTQLKAAVFSSATMVLMMTCSEDRGMSSCQSNQVESTATAVVGCGIMLTISTTLINTKKN